MQNYHDCSLFLHTESNAEAQQSGVSEAGPVFSNELWSL